MGAGRQAEEAPYFVMGMAETGSGVEPLAPEHRPEAVLDGPMALL
jgi:hypothetical protein